MEVYHGQRAVQEKLSEVIDFVILNWIVRFAAQMKKIKPIGYLMDVTNKFSE